MTYYVSSGMLNSTHSLTQYTIHVTATCYNTVTVWLQGGESIGKGGRGNYKGEKEGEGRKERMEGPRIT